MASIRDLDGIRQKLGVALASFDLAEQVQWPEVGRQQKRKKGSEVDLFWRGDDVDVEGRDGNALGNHSDPLRPRVFVPGFSLGQETPWGGVVPWIRHPWRRLDRAINRNPMMIGPVTFWLNPCIS